MTEILEQMKENLRVDEAGGPPELVCLFSFFPLNYASYFFNKYPAANKYFPPWPFKKQHLKAHQSCQW